MGLEHTLVDLRRVALPRPDFAALIEEKAEVWPRIVEDNRGDAGYASKTDRDIPVVICEPRGRGSR